MNWPDVTTRSPAFKPLMTSYLSFSASGPSTTVRGSNFPPGSATNTVFFSPLRSTAESGTSNAEGSSSDAICTETNMPGLRK